MEKRIDLHVHTAASDGSDTPAEAVQLAKELGLAAIAITDHDGTGGIAEAVSVGRELGVEIIPGIEVSADHRGREAHILGLFIDPDAEALRPVIEWSVNEREMRNRKILDAFAADGIDISLEALQREFPGAVIGRPHMAEHLMRKGYVASVKEAFNLYLGVGMPYYRPRQRISLTDAAQAIRASGGLPIIAHPLQYGYNAEQFAEYIETCRQAGCVGLEAYYSEHSPEQRDFLLRLASETGMLVSGGSDYHGTRKPLIHMGYGIKDGLFVPYSVLEDLRRALAS